MVILLPQEVHCVDAPFDDHIHPSANLVLPAGLLSLLPPLLAYIGSSVLDYMCMVPGVELCDSP